MKRCPQQLEPAFISDKVSYILAAVEVVSVDQIIFVMLLTTIVFAAIVGAE